MCLSFCLIAVLASWAQQALHVDYWFDRDSTTTVRSLVHDGTVQLDVSELSDGLHTLHVMAVGQIPSSVQCYSFVKVTAPDQNARLTCVCSIDGEPFRQEDIAVSGGKVNWLLDVAALPQGLHQMRLQVVASDGAATSVRDAFFWRVPTAAEFADMRCYYAIDDDEFALLPGNVLAEGISHFEADVTAASNGLHRITFMLTDGHGNTTSTQMRFFVKIPLGGNGINGYTYWLNDDNAHQVSRNVSPQQETYSLVTMLPVTHQPIRSEDFEFVVENGSPVVYARNTLHLRFIESSGRFVDMSREFIDPTVKRTVTNITELQSGQTKSAAKPGKDEILWYKVSAQRGDSLCFKADRACTMQVFSPTGEQLRIASGDKSIAWCGVHAPADGIYYIAQHDVTAQNGNTLSISYQHIDKYAVLDYDVHTVGNGGMSTITLNGNGFYDLYELNLVSLNNDTIPAVVLSRFSNAQMAVTWDFTGMPVGQYHAVLRFVDDDMFITDFLAIEEAKAIELELSVGYPSSFLHGRPVTYTIEIANHGNMTAYALPVELELLVKNRRDISKICFDDERLSFTVPQYLLSDTFDIEAAQLLAELIDEKGDLPQFIFGYDSISGRELGYCPLILDIPPSSSRRFSVTINSLSSVTLNAIISKDWMPMTLTSGANRVKFMGFNREKMCCSRERIECGADLIGSLVASKVPPHIGCALSLSLNGLEALFDVWCTEGKDFREKWKNYLEANKSALCAKIVSSVLDCVLGYFQNMYKQLRAQVDSAVRDGNYALARSLYEQIVNLSLSRKNLLTELWNTVSASVIDMQCIQAFKETKPNCPPNPDEGGGESTMTWPRDPNEMLGYLAPSGNRHIGNGKTDVFYTICFENDSSALAPANVIVLTDTIDGNVHDLSSFAPTRVKIGNVMAEWNGGPNSVQTVDLRPDINCIAQVESHYSQQSGIVVFTLTSLDPMTMEPITDFNQGMLPPNWFGSQGQGELSFNISLKKRLPEGTEIRNRAAIKFDNEQVIMTPDWVNVIDGVAPECHIDGCALVNDSTAAVGVQAMDDRSGPWRYDVYAQYGEGSEWYIAAHAVPADSVARVRVYEGIDHGFYAVLTDSAGNVESKMPLREYSLDYPAPTTNSDLTLALVKGWNWMSHNLNDPLALTALKPNAYRIVGQNGETIKDPIFGYTGTISTLDPTQLYKVQMTGMANVHLSGMLYNAAFKSTDLSVGWNWLGYPLAAVLSPDEALIHLNAQDGDCIVGQEGMAIFSDGRWSGTLTRLHPGQGYMLKSQTGGTLHWNSPRVSIRQNLQQIQLGQAHSAVDSHQYPNVMGLVADIYDSGSPVDANRYGLLAYCGDECRGVAQVVNGHLMMNIYGTGGETLTFRAVDRSTDQNLEIAETLVFASDVEGTLVQPIPLHIGTSALHDMSIESLRVFPTVTTGEVNITQVGGTIGTIDVLNDKGQVLETIHGMGSHAVVSLDDRPDGVYLMRVTTATGVSTTKVVKQK